MDAPRMLDPACTCFAGMRKAACTTAPNKECQALIALEAKEQCQPSTSGYAVPSDFLFGKHCLWLSCRLLPLAHDPAAGQEGWVHAFCQR